MHVSLDSFQQESLLVLHVCPQSFQSAGISEFLCKTHVYLEASECPTLSPTFSSSVFTCHMILIDSLRGSPAVILHPLHPACLLLSLEHQKFKVKMAASIKVSQGVVIGLWCKGRMVYVCFHSDVQEGVFLNIYFQREDHG